MNSEAKIFNSLRADNVIAARWPQAQTTIVPGTPFTMVTFGDGSTTYLDKMGQVVPQSSVAKSFWLDIMGKPEVLNYFLRLHKDQLPDVVAKALGDATAKDSFAALVWQEMARGGERFS
jgi:hypothetical protein